MDAKDRHDYFRLRPRNRLVRSMILNRRACFALFLVGISLIFIPWSEKPLSLGPNFAHQHGSQEELRLHLLIPATSANPNFCRTTLSAALLDYPTPVLINWEGEEDAENPYASHLAKIEHTLEYLRGLPPRNDKDLVLIVDGYDVWFQLRPEVLIQRYYAAIKQNSDRLAKNFNPDVIAQHDIKQTVIFGADKKCWPQSMNYPACYAVPESPLPKDLFGKKTDSAELHQFARPRWLNSGTVLGPVSEVRAMFEATSRRVQDHFHGFSDQWYFGEIFGDQEYRRNSLSKHPRKLNNVVNDSQPKRASKRSKERNILPSIEAYQQTEFHMGLDYESSLFHTNAFAEGDTEWIKFNSTKLTERFMKSNYVKFNSKKGSGSLFPSDIMNSRPPISRGVIAEELFEDSEQGFKELSYNTTWTDVPLMVNTATGSVPVIIHLNGKKERLDEWWQELWWAKNGWGRHLLRNGSRAPRGPLGTTIDAQSSKTITWWKGTYNSLRRENGGYWSAKGEWLYYNHLCAPHEKVLFKGKKVGTPERVQVGWKGPKEENPPKEEHAEKKQETASGAKAAKKVDQNSKSWNNDGESSVEGTTANNTFSGGRVFNTTSTAI